MVTLAEIAVIGVIALVNRFKVPSGFDPVQSSQGLGVAPLPSKVETFIEEPIVKRKTFDPLPFGVRERLRVRAALSKRAMSNNPFLGVKEAERAFFLSGRPLSQASGAVLVSLRQKAGVGVDLNKLRKAIIDRGRL